MSGTSEQTTEWLLALEEIRTLPLLYSVAIETRDVDAMAALFSPNARFGDWGSGETAVRALMQESLSSSVLAVILVTNHLIELDDADHAHGQVWARCYAQNDGEDFVEQLIKYVDRYERVNGRWLFLHRRHRLWFGAPVRPSPYANRRPTGQRARWVSVTFPWTTRSSSPGGPAKACDPNGSRRPPQVAVALVVVSVRRRVSVEVLIRHSPSIFSYVSW